jgi:hypothetical protein
MEPCTFELLNVVGVIAQNQLLQKIIYCILKLVDLAAIDKVNQ